MKINNSSSTDDLGRSGNENAGTYNIPIEMAVPVVGVGAFILALTLVFCVYQCLIRRSYRSKPAGYKKIVIQKQGKINDLDSLKCHTCVICLDSFKIGDIIALCPCGHVFHKKCLSKWLKWRLVCPMCMEEIRPPVTAMRSHEQRITGRERMTSV